MKKHLPLIALCLFLTVCFPFAAPADLIIEPDDDFYRSHRQECAYEDAAYTANGPDGGVTFYVSPENRQTAFRLDNGTRVRIDAVYTDPETGTRWGAGDHDCISGWAPMDCLWEAFSSDLFMEQYRSDIAYVPYTEARAVKSGSGGINFWRYPGSDECVWISRAYDDLSCNTVYTDPQGREWGYVSYYYGMRDSWIFLDSPGAAFEEIFPDGAPAVDLRGDPCPPSGKQTAPDSRLSPLIICGVAAAAVSAGTALLFLFLKRKKV